MRELEIKKAGERAGEPQAIGDVLRKCRHLVLLGDPGTGKTTLAKWLARTYALGPAAVKDRLGLEEDLVPVVIPVAAYAKKRKESVAPDYSLLDYIQSEYNNRAPSLGDKLRTRVAEGRAFRAV